MKTVRILAALVLMLAISTATNAQAGRSRIQHKRIAQGVRNGELTRNETRQLASEQRNIRLEKREARADGVVTPAERREIRRDKRHASRNIIRKKHNRRVR